MGMQELKEIDPPFGRPCAWYTACLAVAVHERGDWLGGQRWLLRAPPGTRSKTCHLWEVPKLAVCSVGAQIENEYGFCGFNDKAYLQHLADTARASLGKEAVLFTTDPPNAVTMGGLYGDDVVSCAPLCA